MVKLQGYFQWLTSTMPFLGIDDVIAHAQTLELKQPLRPATQWMQRYEQLTIFFLKIIIEMVI